MRGTGPQTGLAMKSLGLPGDVGVERHDQVVPRRCCFQGSENLFGMDSVGGRSGDFAEDTKRQRGHAFQITMHNAS